MTDLDWYRRIWDDLHTMTDDGEWGTCDECGRVYNVGSRDGRCGGCGNCADHCAHVEEGS